MKKWCGSDVLEIRNAISGHAEAGNVGSRYKKNVRWSERTRRGETYNRHLATFSGPVVLISKALGHSVINCKPAPEKDTHFTVLA